MPKFRTQYTSRPHQASNPGDRYVKERQLVLDEDGKKTLKVTGVTDIQKLIDAEAPSVCLALILERFNAGDTSVLEKAKGFYADVTDIPCKLQDVMNLNLSAAQFFDELPSDMRQIYGNEYTQFLFNPKKLIEYVEKKNEPENVVEKVVKHDDEE